MSAVNSAGEGTQTTEAMATPSAPAPDGGDMTLIIVAVTVVAVVGVGAAVYLMRRKKQGKTISFHFLFLKFISQDTNLTASHFCPSSRLILLGLDYQVNIMERKLVI